MEKRDKEEKALQELLGSIGYVDFEEPAKPTEGTVHCYTNENRQDAAYFMEEEFQGEANFNKMVKEGLRRSSIPLGIGAAQQEKAHHEETMLFAGVRKRSPPVPIFRNKFSSEKVAELFPSDSDLSSFGMAVQSRSSGSAFSVSRPSSIQSGYSDQMNMSGVGHSMDNAIFLDSLDLAHEQAKKNSSKIDNIQKGTSKRAVRMLHFTAELRKRMTGLEESQRVMEDRLTSKLDQLEQKVCKVSRWISKEEEYSAASQEITAQPTPAYHLPHSIAMTWVVPYADLKRHSVPSILSSPLQLPWAQDLQAMLYLKGMGKGLGSHLSILFSVLKTQKNSEAARSYPLNIRVQVINHEDSSETIEKKLLSVNFHKGSSLFKAENLHPTITKLIPISTVEDSSLGFLIDGRIFINISVEDIP